MTMPQYTRRGFLRATLATAAFAATPSIARAMVEVPSRSLHFYNTHTGESLNTIYWEQGTYLAEPLKDIAYILRDHRTNDMLPIEPRLLDVLVNLHQTLGSKKPFEVISGYRSPRTNAMLHSHSKGVASHSLHMSGQAIDIRLADRSLSSVRKVALIMGQGGVGYYPASNFVHVDIGPVRQW